MTNALTRVAIVSSCIIWRDRIGAFLSEAGDVVCVGLIDTIGDLQHLPALPDVAILDGADDSSVERLTNEPPAVALVLLIDQPERDLVIRLLPSGSLAILPRDPSPPHLNGAIRAAAAGLIALSPGSALDLHNATHSNLPHSSEWIQPLTPRELQILRMLSEGAANRSIAAQLQISEHTAKFHVGQILAKLGAESRTEAVTIGIRQGLIMA
jgi:DNA-binding NarL/FixJ family response regulator